MVGQVLVGQGGSPARQEPGLNAIQRSILPTQIRHERLVAQWRCRHALAQLAGAVNLLVQPSLQSTKVSTTKVGVEVTQVAPRRVHELGRVKIAESVCRE